MTIARAAVVDSPVMILDEATSPIDTRTERQIEQGLDVFMQNRTVFVIEHRLSTVRNADAILVIEDGQISERGDHEDQLTQSGRYSQLYTGQSELELRNEWARGGLPYQMVMLLASPQSLTQVWGPLFGMVRSILRL